MTCKKCAFPINPGSTFCPNCGASVLPNTYDLEKFNSENVEKMFSDIGLNTDNYLYTMTKVSSFLYAATGTIANFARQYCVINFDENELVLFMLSRLDNKKVTNIFKIPKSEIESVKISNILISYNLTITAKDGTLKFQLFKKVKIFSKQKESIKKFKELYTIKE